MPSRKVRLSINCTKKQRMHIQALAAKYEMTVSEFMISCVEKQPPTFGCKRNHKLNEETKKSLEKCKDEERVSYDTLEEFWEGMGEKSDAKD